MPCLFKSILGFTAFCALPLAAVAQTAQLIVTAPAALAGNYAAVTYLSTPNKVVNTTPASVGNFFIFDDVNCSTSTVQKPVAGSAAGRVALLTGNLLTGCNAWDDAVRVLQAQGVSAVVIGLQDNDFERSLLHSNPTGLTVPVLFLQEESVAAAIRSAVVGGTTVNASFLALPGTFGRLTSTHRTNVSTLLTGAAAAGFTVSGATPGVDLLDYASVDLAPGIPGKQTSVVYTSGPCQGMSFGYNSSTKLISYTIPAGFVYTGVCELIYLMSDLSGLQVASALQIYINVLDPGHDKAYTTANTAVTLDVFGNDIGPAAYKVASKIDLNIATDAIEQTVSTAQGVWQVVGNSVRFTPASGFIGTTSINYRVAGANLGFSNLATLTVYVSAALPFTGTGHYVREFYLVDRDIYFRTADQSEANAVASGAAGAWVESPLITQVFRTGGSQQVCRFYGNANINPATGQVYGPSSHFYTIDAGECATLKGMYNPNAKSWKFEGNDFWATPVNPDKTCPVNTVPIFRAYNNGFPVKDANHRYSPTQSVIDQMVAKGWSDEGPKFCVPS